MYRTKTAACKSKSETLAPRRSGAIARFKRPGLQLIQNGLFYYKMRQLLQNATFIANCDSTHSKNLVVKSLFNKVVGYRPGTLLKQTRV